MPVEHSSVGRRSRGLSDIAPQYVAKSGLCASSEIESPRGGSIRIRHLTGSPGSTNHDEALSRFPRLDQCAHFHYDHVDLPPLQVSLYHEEMKSLGCCEDPTKFYPVQVKSHGVSWLLRRTYDNFKLLDQQLHRCIYDRKFSGLPEVTEKENDSENFVDDLFERYLARFSQIAGNLINCGPVLNWLELDNRGRRLLVPDTETCPINTPAVAAAYSVRRYSAQAVDEISFEVGDMISVIDMPPPEESVWWRGKRGFQVGFFPGSCVAVIGDKVPRSLKIPHPSAGGAVSIGSGSEPSKPVLRKHGKLIAFFRSFILARPSRRRLKQSGILKERVFGCDLGEHLLNSGHQVPMVLKCCAEFIESNGIVDGIYRLSGVTSNIQKLRNAFDEDRVPALYEDEAILQDIHSVASLLKMYFRELPNPLCTYQLYHAFVQAVGSSQEHKLLKMRETISKLPPPHYRTLQYLMRHLARVAERGHETGMTPRNVAIVWAPNLLRCKELEVGGVAALQCVAIQAVVTEFLVCYADLIFCDNLPANLPPIQVSPKRSRPKSLAISTPTKLLSLEEARTRALNSSVKSDTDYIEVGGGPSQLPAQYHTVIELPRKRTSSSKRSPMGWKSLFSKSGRKSSMRKSSTPTDLGLHKQPDMIATAAAAVGRRSLRPVKSAESLNSGANSSRNSTCLDIDQPLDCNSPLYQSTSSLSKPNGHNRSISHDSYFDCLETPVHARPKTRPSRLQEMDNEDASSSLDLSEIQLNFDLEESEMRIFSEDETLVASSIGSGSLFSTNSPRLKLRQQLLSNKRLPFRDSLPPRARAEEGLSCCPSLDPSPKKQKTCSSISPTDSTRSKRSRLEEQLVSSTGELRFIDSQSPDNTVIVHAEVHPLARYSYSDTESYDQLSATPDTPVLLYTTLVDRDSNCSTTPSPSLNVTPCPSTPSNRLSMDLNLLPFSCDFSLCGARMSQSSSLDIPYNRLSGNSGVSGNVTPAPQDGVFHYENVPVKPSQYENVVPTYLNVSPLASPVKESLITIRYENVKSPVRLEPDDKDNVYQNLVDCKSPDNLYEDVEVKSDSPSNGGPDSSPPTSQEESSPPEVVYQQVKYLRRSVNEVNQLLDTTESEMSSRNSSERTDSSLTENNTESEKITSEFPEYSNCLVGNLIQFDDSPTEVEASVPVLDSENFCEQGDSSLCDVGVLEKKDTLDKNVFNENVFNENVFDENPSDIISFKDECTSNFRDGVRPLEQSTNEGRCSEEEEEEEEEEVLEEASLPSSLDERMCESEKDTVCCTERTEVCSKDKTLKDDVEINQKPKSENLEDFLNSGYPPSDPKRRIESEIGRDILRQSKMCQELDEIRTSNPSTKVQNSIKELLSKFETSPTKELDVVKEFSNIEANSKTSRIKCEVSSIKELDMHTEFSHLTKEISAQIFSAKSSIPEPKVINNFSNNSNFSDLTPKLNRRYGDAGSLPPCLRARAAKTARKLANTTALSISLDEDQFLTSNSENQITRVLTSPDIVKDGSECEERQESGVLKPLNTIDFDDAQRRARIEKYKEERRNFLREKYRSDSFKGERDEIVQRLKQKTGKLSPDKAMDTERVFSDRLRSDSLPCKEPPKTILKSPERLKKDSRFRYPESSQLEAVILGVDKVEDEGTALRHRSPDKVANSPISKRDGPVGKSESMIPKREGSVFKFANSVPKRESQILKKESQFSKKESPVFKFEGSILKRDASKLDSPTKSSVTCVLVKERQSADRMDVRTGLKNSKTKDLESVKSSFDRHSSPNDVGIRSPTRNSLERKRVELAKRPSSIDTTYWNNRVEKGTTSPVRSSWNKPTKDVKSPTNESAKNLPEIDGSRRKSSSGSPSYCIRDMTALFENRDGGSAAREQSSGKHYMSSV